MKKIKNIFTSACLIIFLFVLCIMTAQAEEIIETVKIGDNVHVTINSKTQEAIISGSGDTFNFDQDGFDPSGKYTNPFRWGKRYKIIIKEGITSIGDYLFDNINPIGGVYNIPNGVTRIGKSAVSGIDVTTVNLPSSLKIIDEYAFSGLMRVEHFNLPDGLTFIGKSAFSSTGIKEIKIPNTVKKIEALTFSSCSSLTKIELPPTITSIGRNAFWYSQALTTLNLPNSLKTIEENAFEGCISLTDINIPGSMKTIGNNAFSGCHRLYNVTMQEGVRTIEGNAFNDCKRLQSIILPSTIQLIGSNAFNQCTMLRSVMILNGNAMLGYGVFNGCPVTLSASKGSRVQAYAKTNSINFKDNGRYAIPYPSQEYISGGFRYKVLTSGTNGGTVQVISPVNNKKTKLTILDSVKLNTYNFTVTSIAKDAFKSNKKLKTVNMGKYVTSIGDRAFYNCSSLISVKFDSRVNEIGKAAFRGCSNLKKVKLPTKVTSIKDELFYGCKKLTTVTFGNYTTAVGNSAFSGCTGLKSITLPSRVKTLGSKAFYNCKNLKKITVKGTALTKVGGAALKMINSQAMIKVPKSKVKKYTTLFKCKGQSKTVQVSK